MFSYKLLVRIFGAVYKHNLVSEDKLIPFRKLNKNYRSAINNNFSSFRTMHQTYNFIQDTLYFDATEYDGQVYKRRLLKKTLVDNKIKYAKIQLPWIDVWDIEEIGDQYVVEWKKLPEEYYTFLELYEKFPSTRARLYPISLIQGIIKNQYDYLENLIFTMDSPKDLSNIITFIPICYIKHFKQNPEDNEFIMMICYVNVVDSELENEFPAIHERFFSIELECDDLESNESHFEILENHLQYLTKNIKSGDETMLLPKNISTQLGSFENKFSKILSHQVFNI